MARGTFSTSNYLVYGGGIITATPLTIAAWVKPSSFASIQHIAGLFYTSAGSGTSQDGWYLRVHSTSGDVYAVVGTGSGSNFAVSASGCTANVWNHCAAKFISATSRYAYLNGVPGTQSTANTVPSTAPDKTVIGVLAREDGSLIQAATASHIAEVGFWNVALDDAEIAALAKGISPLLIRPQNLIGPYPLLRGDSSGDEPNPKNAAYKLVEQGTISVQPHPRIFYSPPKMAFPVRGALGGSLGMVSETDTALGLGKVKQKALGMNSETDTSLALGRQKQKAIGLNSETDSALGLGRLKQKALGIVAEVGSALGLGRVKQKTLGMAVESDSAMGISVPAVIRETLGMAGEVAAALPMMAVKVREGGVVPRRDVSYKVPERAVAFDAPERDVDFVVR